MYEKLSKYDALNKKHVLKINKFIVEIKCSRIVLY